MDRISSRELFHYAQLVNSGRFAKFDYGPIVNLQVYNQTKPPSYPLKNIKSKHIYLHTGLNDALADPKDVKRLIEDLPSYLF